MRGCTATLVSNDASIGSSSNRPANDKCRSFSSGRQRSDGKRRGGYSHSGIRAAGAAEAGAFVVAATAGLEADTDNPQDEEKLNAPITFLTVSNTVF